MPKSTRSQRPDKSKKPGRAHGNFPLDGKLETGV